MVNRVIQEEMVFPFEFISPTMVTVEETAQGVAMIKGTLLAEGVSRNGNLYEIKEMAEIAKRAIGTPIYVGTMRKRDPNTGLMMKNKHANVEENRVGEIIHAWLDKAKRKIKFIAELVNTEKHPNIIKLVKKGWGISIGGVATKAKIVITETARLLTKIAGLMVNHVQLLPPNVLRGQDEAKVENVEVQESVGIVEEQMIFVCDPCKGCRLVGSSPKKEKQSALSFKVKGQLGQLKTFKIDINAEDTD